jgi:ComF family protein
MIHHLKYEGYWRVGMDLADVMVRHVTKPAAGTLLPIPLGRRRARERGYNQAACLARGLAVRWGMDVDDSSLVRAKETRSQTTLTPGERARNVANVFAVAEGREEPTSAVILVDDVLTTGATLASAAGTLERAGWSQIHAVTFARVMPFEVSVGQNDPQRM